MGHNSQAEGIAVKRPLNKRPRRLPKFEFERLAFEFEVSGRMGAERRALERIVDMGAPFPRFDHVDLLYEKIVQCS